MEADPFTPTSNFAAFIQLLFLTTPQNDQGTFEPV